MNGTELVLFPFQFGRNSVVTSTGMYVSNERVAAHFCGDYFNTKPTVVAPTSVEWTSHWEHSKIPYSTKNNINTI